MSLCPRLQIKGTLSPFVSLLAATLFLVGVGCTAGRKVSTPTPKMVSVTEPESPAQQQSLPPEQHVPSRDYDLLHTRIEIASIDWQNNSLEASTTVTLTPFRDGFDRITLDAGNMSIHGVERGGKALRMEYDPVGEKLTAYLDNTFGYDDTLSITIRYTVHSKQKGLFFIKPDSLRPNRPRQIWTQGEARDNHFWFPTFDDPIERMTSEVLVTVADTLETLSNGRLVNQHKNADGTRTDHWLQDQPHAPYLVMLAVGDYAIVEDEWEGVPLQYYVYREHAKYARLVFGPTADMMEFFSTKLGVRYPWAKYAQVIVKDFTAGAMENTTATVMAERVMHDERAHIDDPSIDIIAHELAHHWFGDLVTAESWAEIFLNESLASYCEVLYYEHARGRDEAMMHLLNQRRVYLQVAARMGQRPMLFRNYEDPDALFDVFSYQKGSNLFHMLRFVLGDRGFWRSLHVYLERNRYQPVDLDDLADAVLEATGQNLDWFFDEWFLQKGHPKFKVTESWDATTDTLTVSVLQTQDPDEGVPIFRMPVDIEVVTEQDSHRFRVWVDSTANEFKFHLPGKPKMVIFDKGDWLLKEIDFPRSKEQLIYQLAHAEEASSRLEAADLLRAYSMPADTMVERALILALQEDPFWGVRRRAALTLRLFHSPATYRALSAALSDPSSAVRASAINALGGGEHYEALPIIERAMSADSSYLVVASAIRAIAELDTVDAFTRIAPMMEVDSHQDIIRRTVLLTFRNLGDRRALPIAQKYAGPEHERGLRLTAISTLLSLATWEDHDVVAQLVGMIRDPYRQAQLFAIRGLGEIGAEEALEPLRAFSVETKDRRLMSAATQAIRQIQDKVEERKVQKPSGGEK